MKKRKGYLLLFIITCLLSVLLIVLFASCEPRENQGEGITTGVVGIEDEPDEFGDIVLKITKEEFLNLGFKFGDSVNIYFNNGNEIRDIAFLSSYTGKVGNSVLVGYPIHNMLKIGNVVKGNPYKIYDMQKGTTLKIEMNSPGKYKDFYDAISFNISQNMNDYDNVYAFTNFREITAGNIKEGRLFRGSTPLRKERQRSIEVRKLLEKYGIKTIVSINNVQSEIDDYFKDSAGADDYITSLYKSNNIITEKFPVDYSSEEYAKKIKNVLEQMIKREPPYYITCEMGIDRTGFVSVLLEALGGASYNEIVDDYMATYKNLSGIDKEKTPKKYSTIRDVVLGGILNDWTGHDDGFDYENYSFKEDAIKYLKKVGLTDEQIDTLTQKLTK